MPYGGLAAQAAESAGLVTVYHLTYGPDGRISSIREETRAQPKEQPTESHLRRRPDQALRQTGESAGFRLFNSGPN